MATGIVLALSIMSIGCDVWKSSGATRIILSKAESMTKENLRQMNLWESGEDGYHTYRIPALVQTNSGTLLAFCEGRRNSRSDSGDIDMLLKRSEDGGKTWSEQQVVWDEALNTCGNPCPVVDRETGDIWLLMTWNFGIGRETKIQMGYGRDSRRVFVTVSRDDGITWSVPREITQDVKKPRWNWYATGPGAGIQIENGPYKGRLVIPCDHNEIGKKRYRYAHVIFSDDHGETWELGGRSPEEKVNECEVVELTGGRLMLNMRNYGRVNPVRQVAISDDGGMTWKDQRFDDALIEPVCQATIRRYTWPGDKSENIILFANPAHTTKRRNMTVRLSYDEGMTWLVSRVLWEGPCAYSCLETFQDGSIGCLYESGEENPYEAITFAQFTLDWLTKP